jgi:membrane protein implicated in regulation of membrane protease activity
MYLVAIGWMYVVLMMAVVEASGANGSVLGAIVTFVFYGLLPLSVVMYILGTPGRRRARQAREQADPASAAQPSAAQPSLAQPDGSTHAPTDPIAPERKEP